MHASACRSLAFALCLLSLAAQAAAATPCREVVKQGRTGGFISFQSEPHARELLAAEARRYCSDLGLPAISDIQCRHNPARDQAVVVEGQGKPLVLERRPRWYCSGEVSCPTPEKICEPAAGPPAP